MRVRVETPSEFEPTKVKAPPSLIKQYKDIHATFKEDVQQPL